MFLWDLADSQCTVQDADYLTFSAHVHEEFHGWPSGTPWATEQQITALLCAWMSMRPTITTDLRFTYEQFLFGHVQQRKSLRSPFAIIWTSTAELKVVCLLSPASCPRLHVLGHKVMDSRPDYARGAPTSWPFWPSNQSPHVNKLQLTESRILKFTCMLMNKYPFVIRQNPCANVCCLPA